VVGIEKNYGERSDLCLTPFLFVSVGVVSDLLTITLHRLLLP